MSHVIYACDIGSTMKGNFGWARWDGSPSIKTSDDIKDLATDLIEDLKHSKSIALGIEAPLFIPVPECDTKLSKSREGEGDRAFSAPAGLAVATLAVHQMAWVFSEIKRNFNSPLYFTSRMEDWPPRSQRQTLYCWEAFVSGKAHSKNHEEDARTALIEFLDLEKELKPEQSAVTIETPSKSLSLIGAAALWSGLSEDLSILHHSAFVVKPRKRRS